MSINKEEQYRTLLKKVLAKHRRSGIKDPAGKIKSGIPGLDDLLGGGIPEGSVVTVTGGTGCGKTVFSLQSLLSRGANRYSQSLILTLDEDTSGIMETAQTFGLKTNRFVHIPSLSSALLDKDELFSMILGYIEKHNVKNVLINSVNAIDSYGSGKPGDFITSMLDLFKAWRINVILVLLDEKTGSKKALPLNAHIYSGSDIVLELKYLQQQTGRARFLSILKARNIQHDEGLQHFEISDRGIRLTGYDAEHGVKISQGLIVNFDSFSDVKLDDYLVNSFRKVEPNIILKLSPREVALNSQDIKRAIRANGLKKDVVSLRVTEVQEFAREKLALPLNSLYNFLSQPFADQLMNSSMFEDRVYGIPDAVIPHCLIYRKDLLRKYGMNIPGTWDELVDQAKFAMKMKDVRAGFIFSTTGRPILLTFLLLLLTWKKEIQWDEDIMFASEGYAPVMEFLHDCIHKHGITPKYLRGYDEEYLCSDFMKGGGLFAISHAFGAFFVNTRVSHRKYQKDAAGFACFPKAGEGRQKKSLLVSGAYIIPQGCRYPARAGEFLSHLLSYETNLAVHTIGQYPTLSGRKDVNKTMERELPFYENASEIMAGGYVDRAHYQEGFARVVRENVRGVMEGGYSFRAAAARIAAGIKAAERIVIYDRQVLDAVRFMEKKISGKLTLKEISGAAKLSPNFFEKMFKHKMNIPVFDYLHKMRMDSAKKMLKERHDLNMSEIAVKTGIPDQNYFSRAFKKHTGLTPTEYRLRNQ